MYDYNRTLTSYLYSDSMIYSPDVVFFRDDANELLPQPLCHHMIVGNMPD